MTTRTIGKILTRDFTLCFFAQFAFTLAAFSLIPTLPIYLLRLGSAEIEIGFLIGATGSYLPGLLFLAVLGLIGAGGALILAIQRY